MNSVEKCSKIDMVLIATIMFLFLVEPTTDSDGDHRLVNNIYYVKFYIFDTMIESLSSSIHCIMRQLAITCYCFDVLCNNVENIKNKTTSKTLTNSRGYVRRNIEIFE